MRQRLQFGVVFFAWFMATGSQWDLTQLVAWSRMFAGYSQTLSFSAAAQKTFSGEMCALCKVVQKGKQEQDPNGAKTPGVKSPSKLLDLCPLSEAVKYVSPAPQTVGLIAAPVFAAGRDRATPPSPPPRCPA